MFLLNVLGPLDVFHDTKSNKMVFFRLTVIELRISNISWSYKGGKNQTGNRFLYLKIARKEISSRKQQFRTFNGWSKTRR